MFAELDSHGALDAKGRHGLRRWLRRLHDEIHVTSVLVTHDQEEALEVADRVVVMRDGRIEQEGTPEEVYHNPANAFVLNFLGNVNLFHSRLEDGNTKTFYVRPHDFRIRRSPDGKDSFRASIRHLNPAGSTVKLDLKDAAGNPIQVEISQEEYRALALRRDEEVFVTPKETRFDSFGAGI